MELFYIHVALIKENTVYRTKKFKPMGYFQSLLYHMFKVTYLYPSLLYAILDKKISIAEMWTKTKTIYRDGRLKVKRIREVAKQLLRKKKTRYFITPNRTLLSCRDNNILSTQYNIINVTPFSPTRRTYLDGSTSSAAHLS